MIRARTIAYKSPTWEQGTVSVWDVVWCMPFQYVQRMCLTVWKVSERFVHSEIAISKNAYTVDEHEWCIIDFNCGLSPHINGLRNSWFSHMHYISTILGLKKSWSSPEVLHAHRPSSAIANPGTDPIDLPIWKSKHFFVQSEVIFTKAARAFFQPSIQD